MISTVFEATLGIFGTDTTQSSSHEFPWLRNLVGPLLPYPVFDFGPCCLDLVNVRAIIGKKKNLRSGLLDGPLQGSIFMKVQMVPDDCISLSKRRNPLMQHESSEGRFFHSSAYSHLRTNTVSP